MREAFTYAAKTLFLLILFLSQASANRINRDDLTMNSTQIAQKKYEEPDDRPTNMCGRYILYRYLVFDAGSSKTRLYIYSFTKDVEGEITLEETIDVGKMTALSEMSSKSSYTTLRKQLNQLLNEAKGLLNNYCLSEVPVYLRATAGLRSLPAKDAEDILDQVREVFMKSPYKYMGEESAEMMTGNDEGYWLWVFMNYVFKNFGDCGAANKVTAFDMGGGSTQLAALIDNIKEEPHMKPNIMTRQLRDCTYKVYSVSYEPYGAQATRIKFFQKDSTSVCIAKDAVYTFKFGDFQATFRGKDIKNENRYDECINQAKNFIKDIKKVWKRDDIPGNLKLVSAFYYIPKTAQAVKKGCKSYEELGCEIGDSFDITIKQLEDLGKFNCLTPVTDAEQIKNFPNAEYLCMDLAYLIVLLRDGYGLENDGVRFQMVNKVGKIEVGWPMGFAYGLVANTAPVLPGPAPYLLMALVYIFHRAFDIFA